LARGLHLVPFRWICNCKSARKGKAMLPLIEILIGLVPLLLLAVTVAVRP